MQAIYFPILLPYSTGLIIELIGDMILSKASSVGKAIMCRSSHPARCDAWVDDRVLILLQ